MMSTSTDSYDNSGSPAPKKKRDYIKEKIEEKKLNLEKFVFGTRADDTITHSSDDEQVERHPAWLDEEDEITNVPRKLRKHQKHKTEDSYQSVLNRQFQRIVGTPKWADPKFNKKKQKESDESEDEDILQHSGNMLARDTKLLKGKLMITKVRDLNQETKAEGVFINTVQFHPTSTVALVAGSSGIASIFQVNGSNNSKLQSVKFKNFSVDCASFSTDGEQFIVGSKKNRHYFCYDMMVGKSMFIPVHHQIGQTNMANFKVSPDGKLIVVRGRYGNIHVINARSKEWITDLKMNSDVNSFAFNKDGSRMFSSSETGDIYEWDMNRRCCLRVIVDDGALRGTSIALSPSDQLLATGSSSGVVNIHEMPIISDLAVPVKTIMNLVTTVTTLSFNSSSEILAVASKLKNNAIKLVHFPSMTVFSNFPQFDSNINQVRTLDFSPSSGYLAIGNNNRTVLLYRLKHYKNY